MIKKISLSKEKDIADVPIVSEDGYVGYLVWTVIKQYNLTDEIPRSRLRVLKIFSSVTIGIQFNKYFYHGLKRVKSLDKAFECRIVAKKSTCPTMLYYQPEGQEYCSCKLKAVN